MVYVFERAEGDKDYYKRERSFKIESNAVKIKNLAVSPSEEQLVCTLANCQAYVLPLSNTDILKSEEMNFELLSQARNSGAQFSAQFWRNSGRNSGAVL